MVPHHSINVRPTVTAIDYRFAYRPCNVVAKRPSRLHAINAYSLDVAVIVSGVASIVIGQVGGACSVLVDNVIRTIRGTSTVSSHDGQIFLEKIRCQVSIFLPLSRLDLMTWMGKDPPVIT